MPDTERHVVGGSISVKCTEQASPQGQKADKWSPGEVGQGCETLTVDGPGAAFRDEDSVAGGVRKGGLSEGAALGGAPVRRLF